MKRSSASLLLEFQSTSSKLDPLPGTQTSITTTPNPPVSQELPHSTPSLQVKTTVSASPTVISSEEMIPTSVSPPQTIMASSHPQKDSQSTAQISFSNETNSTIISDPPSNLPSHNMSSFPKRTVNSGHLKSTFHSTTNSSFLSPQTQLTFNPAYQTQMCLGGPPPPSDTFDSPAVTRGTSSVFHSAVNTLLDVDTIGDEHMEYEDVDSNYSSFDSSILGSQTAYNITPRSALNRSFSLPPHRYGMSSRYYSPSDYVSACAYIIWIMYFEKLTTYHVLIATESKLLLVIVCFGYVCGTVHGLLGVWNPPSNV